MSDHDGAHDVVPAAVAVAVNAAADGGGNAANGGETAAPTTTTAAAATAPATTSSTSSTLASFVSSVKRNSAQLSHAISAAAHGTSSSNNSHPPPNGSAAGVSDNLAGLQAQHANELAERDEQTAALKMNIQHLHKKSQDLERQNATLMAHLSNLEEERHSLAEKREREMKRRQAREAAKHAAKDAAASGAGAHGEGDEPALNEEDDEDDIDVAREKWAATRRDLQSKLAASQGLVGTLQVDLASARRDSEAKDQKVADLTVKVSDEQKNFDRILAKMSEKDEELMKLREENNHKNQTIQAMKNSAAASASQQQPQPSQQPSGLTSPSKSPSSLRSFFSNNKNKQQQEENNNAAPAQPQPAPAAAAAPASAPAVVESTPQSSSSSDSVPTPAAASAAAPAAAVLATPSSPSSSARGGASIGPWSSSQSSDEQILSLQSELISLKVMNEHLLGSIQKKDSMISRIQDEGERVMAKLAEKEMQVMQLREGAGNIEEMQRELKRRENAAQKLQQQVATLTAQAASASSALSERAASAASAASAAELKAATDAIAVVNAEFDSLKETLENTKDMLFLAETQLIDKQKLLGEQAETLREMRSAAEGHEATIGSLMAAKEKGEKAMNEHVDYLERKCISEIEEWERKYDTDMIAAREEREGILGRLEALKQEAQQARTNEEDMRVELAAVQKAHAALVTSEANLTKMVSELTHRLAEGAANASIETRKRNQLVLELKTALKTELIRSKENQAKLKMAEDDITTLRVMNQHQISSSKLTVDPSSNGNGGDSSSANGDAHPESSTTSAGSTRGGGSHGIAGGPSVTESLRNGGGGAPTPVHSAGVEQEVTVALAQKLAQLQNEKHTLMKRQRGLEEHCELLENDVLQKKEMIRNLVRRIDTGALSTNDGDSIQKTQFGSLLNDAARQSLFEKMELILQETTLQNAQYKNNLQSMGGEVSKLMAELDERAAELAAAKDQLEAANDETEIAQQEAEDSRALLRATEAQLKKMERAIGATVAQLEQRAIADEVLAQLEAEVQAAIKQAVAASKGAAAAAPRTAAATKQPEADEE